MRDAYLDPKMLVEQSFLFPQLIKENPEGEDALTSSVRIHRDFVEDVRKLIDNLFEFD